VVSKGDYQHAQSGVTEDVLDQERRPLRSVGSRRREAETTLGFPDQDADNMTREVEGVVPVADGTEPFLPAIGLARPIEFVNQGENDLTPDARDT
jgi:hypothetical protein